MILSNPFTKVAFSTGWAIVAPFVPFVALAALLMGAVWFLDHRGYERAERDAERRWQEQIAIAAADARRRERETASAINKIDKNTSERLKNLQVKRQTIVQNITQELANDPRYYNREFALSDRVQHYINSARAESSVAAASGKSVVELPIPPATD